ncbi:glycosyltransferase family 8 protein, partial [Helicobacter suis]|uniref:glycosyltransferase family 8 protein n=1 Tax=Helicobacter suis TaxID=104628 RepID=UPI0013D7B69E
MITIPIVMAFDLNYYVAGGVAIYSLLMHAAQEREGEPLFYKIHLLIQGLDFSHQQELVKIAAPFADFSALIFHDIGQKQSGFGKFFEQNITPLLPYLRPGLLKRFSSLVLYRFFLSSLFSEYDKIIACDVDTLFERDISPAYFAFDTEEPYYLAAVREYWQSVEDLEETYRDTAKKLGAGSDINSRADMETLFRCCINVGFVVANLKKWREDSLESRMIAIFKEKGSKLVAFEQEVINFACQGQILELPRVYNYAADIFNDYFEMQTPVVWHFLGHKPKPWEFKGETELRFKRWMRVFLLVSISSEKFMTHALITHPSREFMDNLRTHFQNDRFDLASLDCM